MTYYTELQRLCDAQTARLAAQQDEIDMLRAILAGRTQERDEARAENARLRAILHEETAAARELAALLESTAPGDAERLRAAAARLERAYRERDNING